MRVIFVIVIVGVLLAGCSLQKGNNTEAEMFRVAHDMYIDWLFNIGLDTTSFMPPIIETCQDSLKNYKWFALSPNGDTVGVEVTVAKSRAIKPELIMFGTWDAWFPFLHTEDAKRRSLTE